jgi:large subunit ribosomal protein L30
MFAVVRLRGGVKTRGEIKDTLAMLHLNRIYHCAVIEDTPSYRGMLQKVKDFVAYGEISAEALAMILKNRGELAGGAKLTDDYIKLKTNYENIEEFAKAVCEGKARLKDLPDLKPVFRLHPPRKGLKGAGTKRSYQAGGVLGNWGREIEALLKKMR